MSSSDLRLPKQSSKSDAGVGEGALTCGLPLTRYPSVTIGHGGGGRLTQQLIDQIFRPAFRSPALDAQGDAAVLSLAGGSLAYSTDSYVVQPLFFPGGNIGSLAVNGTCNDLAMMGARPQFLSVGFILEEGFDLTSLKAIVHSMAEASKEIGVSIVTGDTKVVERGKGDGLYINTSGIGLIGEWGRLGPDRISEGDVILLSGSVGRHGVAILSSRQGLEFETEIQSDCSHLWPTIEALFKGGVLIHAARDLTRGGLATALIELSQSSSCEMEVREKQVIVDDQVRGACAMLGLDPFFVANEGRMVVIVPRSDSERALEILTARDPNAREIGCVKGRSRKGVRLRTDFGSGIWLELQSGEQLPRIC